MVKKSDFKQQKMEAWMPVITATTMLPFMIAIAVLFIPIGIGIVTTADKVKENVIVYSDHPNCQHCKEGLARRFRQGLPPLPCNCSIEIKLPTKWPGDVYFGYGLENFYQNNFRYINSRDDHQLGGNLNNQSVSKRCEQFDKDGNDTLIAPCGAIANSLFSDVFALSSTNYGKVMMTHADTEWPSDRKTNFGNPSGDLKVAFAPFATPKNWHKRITEMDEYNDENNGLLNNDFIVWMRPAAFPSFRKLSRHLDRNRAKFKHGLPGGDYLLTIHYNYPVENFGGKKMFIMTTSSWIGGKNRFIGIGYICVGCISLFLGFVFLLIHMSDRTEKFTHIGED